MVRRIALLAVVIIVIAGLLGALIIPLVLSASQGSSTTSSFVNQSAAGRASASSNDSAGLTLKVSDNASRPIGADQSLGFSIALYNPQGSVVNASGENLAAFAANGTSTWRFPFTGFPISPNPWCFWNEPYQFVVLKGDYNSSVLQDMLGLGFPVHILCMENGATQWYLFQPDSFNATLDIPSCAANCSAYTLSSQSYSSNSTVRIAGYWDPSDLPNQRAILGLQVPRQWVPGAVYTVAVGDAWGGLAILHFSVSNSAGGSPVAVPIVCLNPQYSQDQDCFPQASATTTTSALAKQVQVVSVLGPLPPINPGGPNIGVTLKNIATTPIVSLNATLKLQEGPNPNVSYLFDVSTSNPLLPGHSIQKTADAINGGFDTTKQYPLTVSGVLANGTKFSFTQEVQVTSPAG